MSKNIWLLTEERPKTSVIISILAKFCGEHGFKYKTLDTKILPIMSADGRFKFRYKVIGFDSTDISEIFILPVSGFTSFVDFMLFYQAEEPSDKDRPALLIEETKTDDTESRNTAVYQRCTKFVVSDYFYRGVKNIMLYNHQIPQSIKPTATSIFGTRMLLTYGVEILGKKGYLNSLKSFTDLDELIESKNSMKLTRNGVSVRIKKQDDRIYITAKLEKNGRLAHDPNIGMLSMMCACIRLLGWKGRIIIKKHGLESSSAVGNKNKFNYIAREYNIELEGIELPKVDWPEKYWQHEKNKEKTGTIFVHVIVENLTSAMAIYENHGGCERGYFLDYSNGRFNPIVVEKYVDRAKYKAGDKGATLYIPDLVLWDKKSREIVDIEGKKYVTRKQGILELKNLDSFERIVVDSFYPKEKVTRSLVLSGPGDPAVASQINELGLYLDDTGGITVGNNAPAIIKEAVAKLSSL